MLYVSCCTFVVLLCLPGKWETTLLDPVFRLGLCQGLGYPAPGTGQRCCRTPPAGNAHKRWTNSADMRFAVTPDDLIASDSWSNLLANFARQAGLTATTDQAMALLIPDQIMPDGQPAPGSVRPIHRADVHIIDPVGSELWLDVKIHTVAPDLAIAKELPREEQTKCRAYGQRECYNLEALDRKMTPIILEQYGRTAPGAQVVFKRIIHHWLQLLVRQRLPHAKRIAASELWVLQAACQVHAECAPKIGPANVGDTPQHLLDSPGETQWMSGLPIQLVSLPERLGAVFAMRRARHFPTIFRDVYNNFR